MMTELPVVNLIDNPIDNAILGFFQGGGVRYRMSAPPRPTPRRLQAHDKLSPFHTV